MRDFDINGLRLAEYQGKLFELSSNRLECSSSIFIRRFLHSDLLKLLDKNESSLISLDVNEGLEDIENQFGKTNYGKIKFSKEVLFWMGYLYRYISYTRDIETPLLMKLINYKQLNELYYVYHTQDLEWCINNLLELNNLTETIFDKNLRLKDTIRKDYLTNLRK